jgi:hypothetical protein
VWWRRIPSFRRLNGCELGIFSSEDARIGSCDHHPISPVGPFFADGQDQHRRTHGMGPEAFAALLTPIGQYPSSHENPIRSLKQSQTRLVRWTTVYCRIGVAYSMKPMRLDSITTSWVHRPSLTDPKNVLSLSAILRQTFGITPARRHNLVPSSFLEASIARAGPLHRHRRVSPRGLVPVHHHRCC